MAANIPISPLATGQPTEIYCVYALSGNYGLLPRLLYYVTLVFAIFGRTREWLVIGALVSALTYAGTAAIHAMVLVASKRTVFDLDIYGAWSVLSTGAMAYVALIHWSVTLRQSRSSTIMTAWGWLVGVALIFGRSALFDTPLSDPEKACYSSKDSKRLLQYPIETLDSAFNCTYQCFSAKKPMRQASEIMAVPFSVVRNTYSHLGFVTLGPIMVCAYAAISLGPLLASSYAGLVLDPRGTDPSQRCCWIAMRLLDPNKSPRAKDEMIKIVYKASRERRYGGYMALYHYVHRCPWTVKKALLYFITLPWFLLMLVVDILCLPLLIINVVLNELMILGSGLPTNEANYAIGQWGPIVSALLVVIAAIINKVLDLKERRQELRNKENLSPQGSTTQVFDAEKGEARLDENEEEQMSGVVVPGLVHVETLRDMEQSWIRPKR